MWICGKTIHRRCLNHYILSRDHIRIKSVYSIKRLHQDKVAFLSLIEITAFTILLRTTNAVRCNFIKTKRSWCSIVVYKKEVAITVVNLLAMWKANKVDKLLRMYKAVINRWNIFSNAQAVYRHWHNPTCIISGRKKHLDFPTDKAA